MSTLGQLVKIAIGPRLAERPNVGVLSHPMVVGFASSPHVLGVKHCLDPGVHRLPVGLGILFHRFIGAVGKPQGHRSCHHWMVATYAIGICRQEVARRATGGGRCRHAQAAGLNRSEMVERALHNGHLRISIENYTTHTVPTLDIGAYAEKVYQANLAAGL